MGNRAGRILQVLGKGLAGFLLMGLLLFGCAGSFRYVNAWVFLVVLALLMLAMAAVLFFREPEVLDRRMKGSEPAKEQKRYAGMMALLFVLSFALAGFGYRFHWWRVPVWGSAAGLVVMGFGYILYAAVLFQNAYAARVVEVQQGQRVIDTGLYAVVRHPMYLACLLLFLAMPFVLGYYAAVLPMLLLPVGLVLRIRHEEAVLAAELDGYAAYMKKTRYRLIPFIW